MDQLTLFATLQWLGQEIRPLYSAPEASDPTKHSPKMDIYSRFGLLLVKMSSLGRIV